jgi:hypothetical protein
MPYASRAQQNFFHANKDKMEKQGVDVDEYDEASKGKKLPAKVGHGHERLKKALTITRKRP